MNKEKPVRAILHGAAGRMGQAVLRVVPEMLSVVMVAALVRRVGGIEGTISNSIFCESLPPNVQADVMIDFSRPDGFDKVLQLALDRNLAFVSGTTGLSQKQYTALMQASRSIPVIWSANFSLGVAMLHAIVKQIAQALPDWDCEIIEAHHRHKEDAPSGTALILGQAVASARRMEFDTHASFGRKGQHHPRSGGEIGIHAVRGGDIAGEHRLMFVGEGERIEITHRAHNRDIFARGALEVAVWLCGHSPGLYSMEDVVVSRA